ncbi:MAG: HEAT repeat domain-containing protein [Lachnospiraceae bacterium]|nr:HEAT repeat domain-containing protein [Lachnospiraceae bacterium]
MPEVIMPPYPEKDEKKVEKLIKGILSNRIEPENVPMEDAYLLYRKDVIEAIVESMKKHGRFHFLCHFGKDLGQPFIEILKESAVSFYGKYPLNPVDVVWHLAGAAENEWYLSVVDKYLSPEVKTSVIEALGGSVDNVEVLIRIYKKGKAAEKRAALTALAQLNPPEAEPIFQKIINKGERVNLLCIMDSEGPVYEAYRQEKLQTGLEDLLTYAQLPDADSEEICGKYHSLREYFRYKTEEEEIFLQIVRGRLHPTVNSNMNAALWYRYMRGKSRSFIEHLYKAEPELLGVCHALCKFSDQTEDCYEVMAGLSALQRVDFLKTLGLLEYAPYMGKYHTDLFEACLFETLPEKFLDFLCDDSYWKPTIPNSDERLVVLNAVNTCCWRLIQLGARKYLPEGDRERLQAAWERFVVKAVEAGYMVDSCMRIIKENPSIVQGREKGLITQYFYNMRMLEKKDAFQRFHEINCFPLSKREKLQELNSLLKLLCAETGKTTADLQRIRQENGMGQDFANERTLYCLQKTIQEIQDEPEPEPKSIFTVLEGGLGKLFKGK